MNVKKQELFWNPVDKKADNMYTEQVHSDERMMHSEILL